MGFFTLFILFFVINFSNGMTTSEEKLQELCSRYKFLWSDADPSVFYYCFNDKAAVQLKCRAGYYMRKMEGQPFHPCDGKYDGNLDELTDGEDVGDKQEAPAEGLPSNGCPDPFLKYENFHRFGGNKSNATNLGECQLKCLQSDDCIGLDYTQDNLCFLLPKSAEQYAPNPKKEVDHYMRTFCSAPTQATQAESRDNDAEEKQAVVFTTTTAAPATATAFTTTVATPAAAACPSTTIPDTGCPFNLLKYPLMGHPFGTNVTLGTAQDTEEECKFYCTTRSYCMGVDWDMATNTCYFFQETMNSLLTSNANVNHYEKTECGRPLNCWSISGSVTDDEMIAITNTSTPQVQCIGLCFLRQDITGTTATVERGCEAVAARTTGTPALGCTITSGNLLTVTCYCDRDRCNGISLEAFSSQILYLPMDGDLLDHSGNNRYGVVANGYSAPTFSCLDRWSNCSALFTGSQCIEVRQLTQTVWGPVDEFSNVSPQFSYSVAFKRLPDQSTVEEGILGNSIDPAIEPSFALIGRVEEGAVRAGVQSLESPTGLNDFRKGKATVNQWHTSALTYDGRDVFALHLPATRFYVDTVSQSGNQQADMGEIQIRDQPVTIGCVQQLNFTGFIDEVRIFNSVLQPQDVQAIQIMQDALYM